jgi:hypothetical protein
MLTPSSHKKATGGGRLPLADVFVISISLLPQWNCRHRACFDLEDEHRVSTPGLPPAGYLSLHATVLAGICSYLKDCVAAMLVWVMSASLGMTKFRDTICHSRKIQH